MPMLRRTLSCVAALAMFSLASNTAEASCGVDYCPLPEDAVGTPTLGVVQVLTRHVEFSQPEGQGSYLENVLRLEVQRFSNWNFGAWIAPVLLDIDGESRTGVSNPVFFVERRQRVGDSTLLMGGVQLELPMGDSHDGIASGHSELLSYVGMLYEHKSIEVQVQGGFAVALSEGHDHAGGNVVFVNPHEDQEAQVRAVAVAPLLEGKLRPGLFLNSRSVIENVDPRHFVTGGLNCGYQLTDAIGVLAQAEVPLSSASRFDWRAGAGVSFRL